MKNIFAKIMSVVLCLFIVVLIVLSFVFSPDKYVLTGGIVVALMLLLVIVFAEVFDHFKFGKIIELEKNVKVKDEELNNSKKENEVLRNQLLMLFQ